MHNPHNLLQGLALFGGVALGSPLLCLPEAAEKGGWFHGLEAWLQLGLCVLDAYVLGFRDSEPLNPEPLRASTKVSGFFRGRALEYNSPK